LFNRLVTGDWPDSLELPTGSGKTSILKIWLITLGWSLMRGRECTIPRRLVWVVNRRVVVDQATEEAAEMARQLSEMRLDDPLAQALRACSFHKKIALAVSTLRGQKADNREWSRDPLIPAIVVGTVDMIGSRLLFRGYRDGRYFRPYHAGLLGVDTLIVNDESHLTPAFAQLLKAVEAMRPSHALKKPFRVLLVSATERGVGDRPFQHDVAVDAAESAQFQSIYEAEKRAYLHEVSDASAARSRMLELALAPGAARTIVFVEEPEKAAQMARDIEKKVGQERVELLTGTMRGFERDRLRIRDGFKKFENPALPDESYYLVTTSAGEVGVNISGERMVTLIRESDRLLQRLGRLNRFGSQAGEAHILHIAKKDGKENVAEEETLKYLRGLPWAGDGSVDVSCRAVREQRPPKESRSETPRMARLDERLIGLWSQTTAPGTGMPIVEHWIHGQQDAQGPETELAWRAEVDLLAREGVSDTNREAVLERYRVLPHETLKEPTGRLREKLQEIPETEQERRVLFQRRDGSVEACSVRELTDRKDGELRDGLILLPVGCGCIDRGMFRASEGVQGNDVADRDNDEGLTRRRYLAQRQADEWSVQGLGNEERFSGLHWRNGIKGGKLLKISIPNQNGDGEELFLILQTKRGVKDSERIEIPLKDHLEKVAETARQIAGQALGELEDTFERAGSLHDEGKRCETWQIPMGGSMQNPLAKTKRAINPKAMGGYRHEFGSLLAALKSHPDNDLLLHLIASHHGWARPYWETKEMAAMDAARRFSRLQRKWGPWGLAYLEALFKAADGIASDLDGSEPA
jgi:CRISPR-associated endonuclease/helicase Cas3